MIMTFDLSSFQRVVFDHSNGYVRISLEERGIGGWYRRGHIPLDFELFDKFADSIERFRKLMVLA